MEAVIAIQVTTEKAKSKEKKKKTTALNSEIMAMRKARYMSFYAAPHGSFDDVKKIPANGQDGFLAVVTLESSFGIYGKKA